MQDMSTSPSVPENDVKAEEIKRKTPVMDVILTLIIALKAEIDGSAEVHEAVLETTSHDSTNHRYKCRICRWDEERNDWGNEIQWESSKDGRARNTKEGDFVLRIDGRSSIETLTILSSYIRKVFTQAILLYAGVKIENSYIEMVYPYPALFHYFGDLQSFVENDKSEEAYPQDFAVLQWYYDTYLIEHYEKARHLIECGKITFDYMWALFCPGDLVVTTDELGHRQLHVLTLSQYKRHKDSPTDDDFLLNAWSMVWSPSRQSFRRSQWQFYVQRFPGSRPIPSLPLFPLRCEKPEIQELLKLELSKRGKEWKALVSERPTCWHCEGAAFDGKAATLLSPGTPRLLQTANVSIEDMFRWDF
jgi:hypothetical protein